MLNKYRSKNGKRANFKIAEPPRKDERAGEYFNPYNGKFILRMDVAANEETKIAVDFFNPPILNDGFERWVWNDEFETI